MIFIGNVHFIELAAYSIQLGIVLNVLVIGTKMNHYVLLDRYCNIAFSGY